MKLKDLNVKLKLYSRQFHTGLTKAGGAAKVFGGQIAGVTGVAGTALKGLGNVVRRLGNIFRNVLSRITRMLKMAFKIGMAAAVAAIGIGIKAAIDFEEQLANVNTMLDETSAKFLPEYASAMKSMAMEFGESTKTLSKGLYDILSASIAPAQAIDVLRTSVIAAKAGMTDAGIAADAITTILNSYGLSASNAADVSDWLFAIVKRGKLTFGDLASGIGKVASTAAIAGVSLEDLGAMVATMTRAGIRSEEAMTAMNGVLRSFLGATDEAKKKAAELGFEMSTNTIRTRGLLWIMQKMNDLTAEQVRELFPNIRGLKGMAAALQQVANFEYDAAFMTNRSGLAMNAFQKMTGTTKFALSKLWQTIKITVQEIGESLSPKIKEVAESLSKWLKSLQKSNVIKAWTDRAIKAFEEFVEKWKERLQEVKGNFIKLIKEDISKAFTAMCDYIKNQFENMVKFIGSTLAKIPDFIKTISVSFSIENFEFIEKIITNVSNTLKSVLNLFTDIKNVVGDIVYGLKMIPYYLLQTITKLEPVVKALTDVVLPKPAADVVSGMLKGGIFDIARLGIEKYKPELPKIPTPSPIGKKLGDVFEKSTFGLLEQPKETRRMREYIKSKEIPSGMTYEQWQSISNTQKEIYRRQLNISGSTQDSFVNSISELVDDFKQDSDKAKDRLEKDIQTLKIGSGLFD